VETSLLKNSLLLLRRKEQICTAIDKGKHHSVPFIFSDEYMMKLLQSSSLYVIGSIQFSVFLYCNQMSAFFPKSW